MKHTKGFSLVELLVVISIIAVLAAVVLPSIDAVRARGRDGKRISDINQIRLALEHYFNMYNRYPIDINVTSTNDISVNGASTLWLSNGILPSTPKDPNNSNYKYVSYCPSTTPTGYHIGAVLEQSNDQLRGDSDGATGVTICSGQSQTDFSGADTPTATGQTYDFKQ